MAVRRIWAIFLQEIYVTYRSMEVIMDLFFFSVISVIVFGFLSHFLAGSNNAEVAYYFLVGMLLWEVLRISQYSISVGSLWNLWSRNLSNIFVAPISTAEFLIAQILSGVFKAVVMLTIISLVAHFVFGFNILQLGMSNIFLDFLNLSIFGWATGLMVLGIIFRFGTKIQSLAWGLIFLFQPLTAAFFPLSVLPPAMQSIAKIFPPTYIFEAARANLSNSATNWQLINTAFLLNALYLLAGIWIFIWLFNTSRTAGQFARNEG